MALLSALLLAAPFLVVKLPPLTDLPQLVAQVRLLAETVGSQTTPYAVHWWHPNRLGYLPLILGWLVGSPLDAGRIGVLLIGVLWAASIHLLASSLDRSPLAATLACLFFFSKSTYWGFLNFQVGLPVFLLWFVLLERTEKREAVRWRQGALLLACSALLYWAHALWLAAGLVWMFFHSLARSGARATAFRLAWTLPVMVVGLVWFVRLGEAGFRSATTYGQTPLERLAPSWLADSLLGGLRGKTEGAVLIVVMCFLGLGLWQHRRTLRSSISTPLLFAAAFFGVSALTLPGVVQNTIFFASRWVAPAAVCLILGLPTPRWRWRLDAAVPLCLLLVFVGITSRVWIAFEKEELDGLEPALERLPEDQRLLGLDTVRTSPRIKDFPYYHLFAYAQVLKGATLNESFAELASSLVVFRDLPREDPWTDRLDWQASRLRQSDIDYFDYLLVLGGAEMQSFFARDERLEAVTEERPWRLWRVGGAPATPAVSEP